MAIPQPACVPRYSIAETERGWLLVIQNEQCSVMQVFSSSASAQRAVDRMLEFFQNISVQVPGVRRVA